MPRSHPIGFTPERKKKLSSNYAAFEDLASRYRGDPDLRARVDAGDVSDLLTELGVSVPAGIEARIVANTADTIHFIFPPDPNAQVSDELLSVVAGGGKTANTTGTVGSAGSFACSSAPSTAGTVGTAGTAG